MNNETKFNLKSTFLFVFFLFTTLIVNAQDNRRVFTLKQGDEFQRDILTNSRSAVQRGAQTLNVNAVSAVTKSYIVTTATANESKIEVKIKKMDNVIDAFGEQLHYNSEDKRDTTSLIKRSLEFMVNKPSEITVDKFGVIQSSKTYKAEFATDTLVAFAGIEPEIFEQNTLLGLFADLTFTPNLKKGFAWTDSVKINSQMLHTNFWVEDVDAKSTIVKFSTKIESQMLNTNSNGTYVVDNNTGLIVEKLVYMISTGYQISAGKVIYAVSRSTSLSERIRKVSK